ncbi:adenylyltransferase [Desulfosarcina alkanivorans]|uniref:Adenylyltransferase n=1 Tax=Desulfosarcina alkanivorans TaxID=571177 RepID=A0A5K7YHT8_9BACT|nr:HesA/MoeB/ThiF family protein [Desulfosarcina alkanivorans]BBO68133.1 adenylyltransferase [Desulfosarcina alkanivorans]
MSVDLSDEEHIRYRRQLIMPEIGIRGQQRLKRATVLIAGLGGLGSVSAFQLTAAGVGCLRIVDMDRVAVHNLNRQILHTSADIGKPKTASSLEKLKALNPHCRIEPLAARITGETAAAMVRGCDLILDGTDNLDTRRTLNRAARDAKIPFVFAGVDGLDGMVATFIPGRSGCLECIFPGDPHRTPAEIGVIAPTVGVIASLQCLEAVRLLTGQEPNLAGNLIHFHGADMRIKRAIVPPNPNCRICSPNNGT